MVVAVEIAKEVVETAKLAKLAETTEAAKVAKTASWKSWRRNGTVVKIADAYYVGVAVNYRKWWRWCRVRRRCYVRQ